MMRVTGNDVQAWKDLGPLVVRKRYAHQIKTAQMIPKRFQTDFYAGKTNDTVKFSINDAVEVVCGKYKGKLCAVISIEQIEPEVHLLLERGDDGSFIKVKQDEIRMIE